MSRILAARAIEKTALDAAWGVGVYRAVDSVNRHFGKLSAVALLAFPSVDLSVAVAISESVAGLSERVNEKRGGPGRGFWRELLG